MTIYYRVNLQDGIKTEEQPTGYYSQHEDLNVTVFKSLRAAKRKFNQITKDEIKRLQELRAKVRGMNTREEMRLEEMYESADGGAADATDEHPLP